MGTELTVTKENFCEIISLVYASAMCTAIVTNDVDIFGPGWGGEPIAPFWTMLVAITITLTI